MDRRSGALIKEDSSTFRLCVWRGPHIYNQWAAIKLMRDFVAAVIFSFLLAAFSHQELQVNLK